MTIYYVAVAVSSAISLIGIIYLAGYWKGQVDSFIKTARECDSKYPPQEIGLQVKTLWDIYAVEALRGRPDLAGHGSPWHLTEKGEAVISASVRAALDDTADHVDLASSWLVIKTLGLGQLQELARGNDLTTPEMLGVLSIHLECQRRGGTNGKHR